MENVAEPTNRGTMLMFRFYLPHTHNVEFRSGFSSINLLDEDYMTVFLSLVFPPFCPFYETFNAKIDEMLSNGIIDHWFRKAYNPKGLERTIEDIGPQVLTWDHLEICFLIWLIFLSLSLIAFSYEIIVYNIKENMK